MNFDDFFTEIAGRSGGLEPLLNHFFGFLHRRTDFYVEYDKNVVSKASMGFPVGIAEKMLLSAFRKFDMKSLPAPAHVESDSILNNSKFESTPLATRHSASEAQCSIAASPSKSLTSGLTVVSRDMDTQASSLENQNDQTSSSSDDRPQIPVGNGGIGPNYYWTQTLKEVCVFVDVSRSTRGRDIKCLFQPRCIRLEVKGDPIVVGDFEDAIKASESLWTLTLDPLSTEDGQIVITLEKTRPTWWKHVIVGHPCIDTTKVDSTQRIDEYDETTQAAIRKIMTEQRDKANSERGTR